MRGLQFIPPNTKINFVGFRYVAYTISTALMVWSLISIISSGFNVGIDFKGGILMEVRTQQAADLGSMRKTLMGLDMGEIKLQNFGGDNDVLIRIEQQKGGDEAQIRATDRVKEALGKNVEYRRVETVGSKVSDDIISSGILAVSVALFLMLLYIWFRFEWQYAFCGIVALMHDVLAVLGFYSITGYEFNEAAFGAILTTIGYSINDSVVVYDRLRENLRKYKTTPVAEVMNLSTNETLSRTILTSGSLILALAALYGFGGPVIENFALPILVGIVFGTFSSIFISVNLLLFFDLRRKKAGEDA